VNDTLRCPAPVVVKSFKDFAAIEAEKALSSAGGFTTK
jgi:hypothetical protein